MAPGVSFLKKWTFREPVLMWTAYWAVGGLTVPFIIKWVRDSSSEPEPKQPPTLQEMIAAIKEKNSQTTA